MQLAFDSLKEEIGKLVTNVETVANQKVGE